MHGEHTDHVIATSGETQINIWKVGENGPTNGQTPVLSIDNAHDKRMLSAAFHPLAENVLVSSAVDKTVC